MSANKVALITGANRGIGLETARQLTGLGYTVLIGSRKATEGRAAAGSMGGQAEFVELDMERPETFSALREVIAQRFGKLDVLVNNAGIGVDIGMKPSTVAMELVRKTFEVNVFGLVELTQILLPLLLKSEGGRIVNLSSILGSLTMNADLEAPLGEWRSFGYNGSKAAVNMFTATLAYELRDTKVKVNSAHPGWVKTELGGEGAKMEIEDGAKTSVRLATLSADGPSGGYFHLGETLPW